MSSILRKFEQKEDRGNIGKTRFMMRNGETVLKELIASSNGKYNPYRIFSAQEIKLATDNYHPGKLIRRNSRYKLYKGFWQDRFISVMKFEFERDGYRDSINNIVYASQMIHKHILHLIGCCLETEIPTLVFESVKYGGLTDRIFGNTEFEPLPLKQRLKIAMDIANALAYLHLGFPRPIVFRGFETASILFNEENDAKLFDFSLSISIPMGETHIYDDVIRGTIEYIAPEYARTGDFNEKLDVYGFGVLIGELLSGQRAYDLARLDDGDVMIIMDHMKKCFEEKRFIEVVDPRIVEDNSCPGKEQLLQASALLMFECVNASPIDRPTMVDVAKRLRLMYRSCM